MTTTLIIALIFVLTVSAGITLHQFFTGAFLTDEERAMRRHEQQCECCRMERFRWHR